MVRLIFFNFPTTTKITAEYHQPQSNQSTVYEVGEWTRQFSVFSIITLLVCMAIIHSL